jgi:hypothetical protein
LAWRPSRSTQSSPSRRSGADGHAWVRLPSGWIEDDGGSFDVAMRVEKVVDGIINVVLLRPPLRVSGVDKTAGYGENA